jgi:hypothetical protein
MGNTTLHLLPLLHNYKAEYENIVDLKSQNYLVFCNGISYFVFSENTLFFIREIIALTHYQI